MDANEADRRKFELQLEKIRLTHNFTKDALLLTFFMFYIGGLSLLFKEFKTTVLMAFLVGVFVVIAGLSAAPRIMTHELDRLMPKE